MKPEHTEEYDDYYDMEEKLERDEVPERVADIWRKMADFYISQEQIDAKGNLLGCYKSTGLRRMYIAIYEKAFIGRAQSSQTKKTEDICSGYVCLRKAVVEDGVLYLIMSDDVIYRLKNIKNAEEAAYRMNEQKRKVEG